MVEKILADASPEKRLFVYLITRDISLAEAVLDLIDNSINAALQPLASQLNTADDYQRLLADIARRPTVNIELTVGPARILVRDTAPGISAKAAETEIFRFGRGDTGSHEDDRLSVYGIGLKRAMFKCGNKIEMVSDHRDGGFELKLNARAWERLPQERWSFEIAPRPPATTFGTRILITELYDDIVRRLDDGLFLSQLQERIAATYAFFIGRIVNITLNGNEISTESFEV